MENRKSRDKSFLHSKPIYTFLLLQKINKEKIGSMKNGLVSTFPFLHEKNAEKPNLSCHNKGFINYVFCKNWSVRNPAGTRLDSLAL